MQLLTRRKQTASAAKGAPARRPRRHGLLDWRSLAALGLGVGVVVAIGLGAWQLERSGRLAALAVSLGGALADTSARLGLAVADIEVEGRAMTGRDAILRAIGAERGTAILTISPAEVKTRLEGLPWVRSAAVERRLPDTLHVRLVERAPFAFWQNRGKLALIDREGTVITDEHLERFPNLIVIVGEDAPRHAASLLDMLTSEPDLAGRVVAAVRIGGRRWNLRLDNGIDVELPEDGIATAWAKLAQLERTSRLLARDVQVIDLRLPDRLVLRVTPEPPKEPAKKGRQTAKST